MKKSRYLWLLLALMVSMATKAQGILGTVTDDLGEPIIGASIVEKGNPQNGTITDFDGKFTIKVDEGTPIIISYIGYTSQEVNARNGMTIVLKEDAQTLQDVVVIGYGVQKKSVVTAAIYGPRPYGQRPERPRRWCERHLIVWSAWCRCPHPRAWYRFGERL